MTPRSRKRPFHLFVYGTLREPSVFRAVLGRRIVAGPADADGETAFHAREAILDGYKKVSPDGTYMYAVPDPQGRIHGYVVGPLPHECLSPLLKYEGRNYSRRTLRVLTAEGPVRATVFVGNLEQLQHHFGYAFQDPLKQEVLLQEKIERALLEAEREQLRAADDVGRRAVGELHGSTIRDLRRLHFQSGGISDYAIRRSIKDPPLRDFARLVGNPEAETLAPYYLEMVVRQVIFNELEEQIHRDFRYELDRIPYRETYYERTLSSLAALRLINNRPRLMDMIVADCLTDLEFESSRLVDYVRWAIVASDGLYEQAEAWRELNFLRTHACGGYVPLGAELEFSNIGHAVIRDPDARQVQDRMYDGFLYFGDFALDALTWKLGGHVDDHHEKASVRPRRGFFEVALGSLSIEANLSKPITDDPWVLNQFIHQARRFYKISPHSVHVSLQLRSQHRPVRDRTLPLGVLKCLFAVGGDPRPDPDGAWRIRRLQTDEIVSSDDGKRGLMFCDIRKRHSADDADGLPGAGETSSPGLYVQQFKFLRLSGELFYEPIVMALKGVQIALRPGSFLLPRQHAESPRHRRLFDELRAWGAAPEEIAARDVERFLSHVHKGLMTERRGKPAHSEAYIAWSLSELRDMLRDFNAAVSGRPRPQPSGQAFRRRL